MPRCFSIELNFAIFATDDIDMIWEQMMQLEFPPKVGKDFATCLGNLSKSVRPAHLVMPNSDFAFNCRYVIQSC